MNDNSAAIVRFIANLHPLYIGDHHGGAWCARSLEDGTILLPLEEAEDDDPDDAFVRALWRGESEYGQVVSGSYVATIAVVRYVQLHGVGRSADQTAAELAHMSQHFTFKTGRSLYLPYDPPGRDLASAVQKALARMGETAVVNLLTKAAGL